MIKLILLFVLLILVVALLLSCAANAVMVVARRGNPSKAAVTLVRLKRCAVLTVAAFLACVGLVLITQLTAYTPAIRENGKRVKGSISELVPVNINRHREWISIRGYDASKPILLFLAGGPGGTQMASTRYNLAELEKHFVVVNWDQPGSGKSYSALPKSQLTPNVYVKDGISLTQYLLKRFGQQKLYLVGESWGSALGIFMAKERPELYHAVVGTGQMVAFVETERIDYHLALEYAGQRGDDKFIQTLVENGEPPYYGEDVTWKSAAYLGYLNNMMGANPQIHNNGFQTLRDLSAQEYGLYDSLNFVRGIVSVFNRVYPQLYDIDLLTDYTRLELPTYFFLGKHDLNAPLSLAQEYYEQLDAPYKELVWFEHSGHCPWINESDRFVQELVLVLQRHND